MMAVNISQMMKSNIPKHIFWQRRPYLITTCVDEACLHPKRITTNYM